MTEHNPLLGPDEEWIDADHADEEIELANLDQPAKHMRILAALTAELDRVTQPFVHEIARLEDRLDSVRAPLIREIAWRQEQIERWHRAALAAKKAKPTVTLPYGKSVLRKAQPKLEIVSPADALMWAEEYGVDVVPDPKPPAPMQSKVKEAVVWNADAEPGTVVPCFPKGTEVEKLAERDGEWFHSETGERHDPVPGLKVTIQHPNLTITPETSDR